MRLKLIIALMLISITTVSAFNLDSGYNWLISKGDIGNYGDIQSTVFSALALKQAGAVSQAEEALNYIKGLQDANGCYPRGNCNTKDTAFALLLMHEFGEDTSKTVEWLKNGQSTALAGGNWWLQVITEATGICKISYTKGLESKEKDVNVDNGKFPDCTGSKPDEFFDLDKCLEPGLLSQNPIMEFDVNCNAIPNSVISLVYQSGNTYTIIDEASTSRATLKVNNGCFGVNSKQPCDFMSSLFVNWVLFRTNAGLDTLPWIESNYDPNNALHNSILYDITKKENYLNNLKSLQRNDGSFNGLVYDTSFAVIALKQGSSADSLNKAMEWLKKQQKQDGSWNSNVLQTAVALYNAFGESGSLNLPSCTNGIKDGEEEGVDCGGLYCGPCESPISVCGNGICEFDEDAFSCRQDCSQQTSCVVDGVCDTVNDEDSGNCQTDCYCGDGICDNIEELRSSCSLDCGEAVTEEFCGNDVREGTEACDGTDDVSCPGQCNLACQCSEDSGGFPWWFILVIILLIGAAYFYFKRKKGGNNKEEKKSETRPFVPQQTYYQQRTSVQQPTQKEDKKSAIESALDRSISEAKKLFKRP